MHKYPIEGLWWYYMYHLSHRITPQNNYLIWVFWVFFRKAFSAPIKLPLEKILDFVDKVLSMDVSSVVGQGQGHLSRSPICHEDSHTFCINIKYLSLFYLVIRKCMYFQKFKVSLYGNYYNVLKWLFMYLNILVNIFACNLLMSISVNFFVIYLIMNISEVLKFQRLPVIGLPPHNPYGRHQCHQCPVWEVWLFSPNDLFCTVFTPLYQLGTWSIDPSYNGWNFLSNAKYV